MKIKNINAEINQLIRQKDKAPFDNIRYKYLKQVKGLMEGKIIIAYYANLNNPEDIIEDDIKSFINLLDEDKSKGIVIIITSNGGDLTAVERVMSYIQDQYHKNIEIIIPQIAMSAATVMSFSAKKIYMTKYSCLGPIDPQIRFNNIVVPGHSIIATHEEAKMDLDTSKNVKYWEIELAKYPPAIYKTAQNGIKLAENVAIKFLKEVMYENEDCELQIEKMIQKLNSSELLAHNQKVLRDDLEKFLKIAHLEENLLLYNAVINYHHAINITFERNPQITKIIESSDGQSMIRARAQVKPQGQNPAQVQQPPRELVGNEKPPRPNIQNQ